MGGCGVGLRILLRLSQNGYGRRMVATWPLSSGGDLRLGRSHHQIGFTPQGREPQETHYGRNPSKTWSSFGIDSVSGTGALPAGAGEAFPGPLEAIGRFRSDLTLTMESVLFRLTN